MTPSVSHVRGFALGACVVLVIGGCAAPGPSAPVETRGRVVEPAVALAPPAPVAAPPEAAAAAAAPEEVVPPVEPPATAREPAVQSLFAAAMQFGTRGEWERAQAALERAVRLAPDYADLWRELAFAQYRQGALEEAGHTARRALALVRAARGDPGPVVRLAERIESARRAQAGD